VSIYLAIETSTPLGSVALGDGENILAEVALGVQTRHSEELLPAIDFMLRAARVDRRQIEGVVVGGGPGSFTGLRIAAASAKAMATALKVPLFAYSGLAALAAGLVQSDKIVCALFDARRGEVYGACYRFPDTLRMQTIMEPAPRVLEEMLALVDVAATVFVGGGALGNAELLNAAGARIAPAHFATPRAAGLLWLSGMMPSAGRVEDIAKWEPTYLRDSGAERMKAR
jgi:tRNA threonylcarbamoyladenosine biosynthesis protein TsaB